MPGDMDLLESEEWSPFIILLLKASHCTTLILQERDNEALEHFYKINQNI